MRVVQAQLPNRLCRHCRCSLLTMAGRPDIEPANSFADVEADAAAEPAARAVLARLFQLLAAAAAVALPALARPQTANNGALLSFTLGGCIQQTASQCYLGIVHCIVMGGRKVGLQQRAWALSAHRPAAGEATGMTRVHHCAACRALEMTWQQPSPAGAEDVLDEDEEAPECVAAPGDSDSDVGSIRCSNCFGNSSTPVSLLVSVADLLGDGTRELHCRRKRDVVDDLALAEQLAYTPYLVITLTKELHTPQAEAGGRRAGASGAAGICSLSGVCSLPFFCRPLTLPCTAGESRMQTSWHRRRSW